MSCVVNKHWNVEMGMGNGEKLDLGSTKFIIFLNFDLYSTFDVESPSSILSLSFVGSRWFRFSLLVV